jgi:GDP-4-dehydro-6-deoxy-D-mannose reductase
MATSARGPDRVLVTGAFGFVGRWLTAELLARDDALKIIGWGLNGEARGMQSQRVSAATVDLTDRAAVFDALASAAPTAVVHLAAISAPREALLDPRKAWDVNLFGTINLAEAVLANAPDARFLHVSSSEIYGGSFSREARPLDETAALEPLNVYALTKSAADLAVGKLAHDGLKAIRFRPFNHTGPGQNEAFVVASLASQIARIEHGLTPPILYVGNTNVSRDILDVRDVVRAYASAVMLETANGAEVLNLASGRSCAIGEIADRLCAMAKVKIDIQIDPKRVRPNDLPRTLGDASRAAAVLGWRPSMAIDQTLRDVLDYWRARTRPANGEK